MFDPINNDAADEELVVLIDFWKTIGTSHCSEPIWVAQRIIGHGLIHVEGGGHELVTDDNFLRHCLTTNISDPEEFLVNAASAFNGFVRPEGLSEFRNVLRSESMCTAVFGDVFPMLRALKARRIRVGIVTNAWAFPFEHVMDMDFNGATLGMFVDQVIGSWEVGHRKPEPEIFLEAARRFGVSPGQCIFIGDNVDADVRGSAAVGMRPVLIDRPGVFSPADIQDIPGAVYINDLREVLSLL